MEGFSDEEDQFFDTREDINSISDSGSDGPENSDFNPRIFDLFPAGFGFRNWVNDSESICERRNRLLKWMDLISEGNERERPHYANSVEIEVETGRAMETSGAVLRNLGIDDGYSTSQSSLYYWSNEAQELLDDVAQENSACRIKNLDSGREFIVDDLGQDGLPRGFREVGSNHLITPDEFERVLGLSTMIQQVLRREIRETCKSNEQVKQLKRGWLRRLRAVACIVNGQVESGILNSSGSIPILVNKSEKIRVRPYRKRSKELSSLYVGQDILAHKGSILTMKFSPDGQYLASGGEDGIVRVWQVTESERLEEFNIPDVDPSSVYFTVNHLSEVVPFHVEKEKISKLKSLRKSSVATCVILPQKIFQISEKPLHEFHGHQSDVLDLSWSKNNFLLSSSADYTVRLWRVGCDKCLEMFLHNNYVTCVEFNPVDDKYFISGSIDGKVRIWEIPGCQVVDWTDITEIVTAVCYHPDGKGGIVGSMTGNCRFYDASDNRLQMYAQLCLQGKKKSPYRRITGFQFSPTDPNRLMVTSADSHVRILHGIDVICKYRGLRNAGSQISASFTSDGVHIISASEDSNVYMWNYTSQEGRLASQVKSNWSCERFFSRNVSVAIPWSGATSTESILSNVLGTFPNLPRYGTENELLEQLESEGRSSKFRFTSPDFSMSHSLFPDSLLKGSATWPEENLPSPSSLLASSAMCKSQYKFLKASCQNMYGSSHAWGLAIVTGSWDGRIRSFQNYGLPIRV